MNTLKELNEKLWYRFFKVLYFFLAIPYIPLLFWRVVSGKLTKKIWHQIVMVVYILLVIPYTFIAFFVLVDGVLKLGPTSKDPYGFQSPAKQAYLNSVANGEIELSDEGARINYRLELKKEISKKYKRFFFTEFILYSAVYFIAIEFTRRTFYYVVFGKVFPKE